MTEIVRTIGELEKSLEKFRHTDASIGFVPTMGALHQGHISLAEKALHDCDICVCSIFVNPVQFNNPADLDSYPRTEDEDIAQLSAAGVQLAFIPDFETMYPNGVPKNEVDFGSLAQVMEGANRPGHFDGVGIVVRRLFELVSPHKAYFGKKDYQQLLIIKHMVEELAMPIDIVPVDIMREENGLAMSSRNMRLTPEAKSDAGKIHAILTESLALKSSMTPAELEIWVINQFDKLPNYDLEYFQISSSDNLRSISEWSEDKLAIGFVVVHLEGVRLIDNIEYL